VLFVALLSKPGQPKVVVGCTWGPLSLAGTTTTADRAQRSYQVCLYRNGSHRGPSHPRGVLQRENLHLSCDYCDRKHEDVTIKNLRHFILFGWYRVILACPLRPYRASILN